MQILLFRHATAQEHGIRPDYDRELVQKGHVQVDRAVEFCRFHQVVPSIVLTSSVTRARQTAERYCRGMGIDPPSECAWLGLGSSPFTMMEELSAYREFESVMIVGHEPDFSSLANLLLGTSGLGVRVKKASLIAVETLNPAQGTAELQFAVPSNLQKT